MHSDGTRRDFLRDSVVIGAAVTAFHSALAGAAESATMPSIRLGKLEVSRSDPGQQSFLRLQPR